MGLRADAGGRAGAVRDDFLAAARARPAVPRGPAPGRELGSTVFELPPDIADFTGRAESVARLRASLTEDRRSSAPVTAAVSGSGGVGKSTLAVHVAHLVRDHFPDGSLYADLRGTETDPATPDKILGRFLRSMGVDDTAIPDGAQERSCLYRSLLADRRVLVVLDNAAGESQVVPLLPGGSGCGVLITSRAALSGLAGVQLMDLDALDPEAAVELLERIIGSERVAAEPGTAATLARQCDQLPLALRIAGARLAARPHWRLADLAGRLSDERRRLDELRHGEIAVRAGLELSYRELDPAARTLLCRLGSLDAPDVATWVVAALLDVSIEQASDLTDRLVEARLLQVAGRDALGQVRYRFHDLVRLYARERARTDDPAGEAALVRAFGGWLYLAERADTLLAGSFFEPVYGDAPRRPVDQQTADRLATDPVRFFESERAALVAAVGQAARLGLTGVCWELCSAATRFWGAQLLLDEWRDCTATALTAARLAGDRRGEAAVLVSLGCLETIRPGAGGRHGRAMDCWRSALAVFEELGEPTGLAMCLAALAVYGTDRAALDPRVRQIGTAFVLVARAGDDPRARACLLQSLGDLFHNHGRFEQARGCFEQALELYAGSGNHRGVARQRYQLGAVLIKQGRDAEAVGELRQALAVLEPDGDRITVSPASVCLATALAHLGDAEARRLLEPWAEDGFPFVRGWALRALGEMALAEGDTDRARTSLTQALDLFRGLDMPAEEAATTRALEVADG